MRVEFAERKFETTAGLAPKPTTMLLLASGLVGLVGLRKRFGKQ